MQHGNSTTTSSYDNTSTIVLACTGTLLLLFVVIMVIHFRRKSKRYAHTNDLEACHTLLSEENPRAYNTFPSSSHEGLLQDPQIRRMIRDQRFAENISGVYQISVAVRRLENDGVSVSSGSSSSNTEEREDLDLREGESEEESSESESDSSDESDSEDSDEVVEIRALLELRRPALPKRVSQLRSMH